MSDANSILVRQLRGPHLRRWPWCRRRSSIAETAAVSPRSLPQSLTGRFRSHQRAGSLVAAHYDLQHVFGGRQRNEHYDVRAAALGALRGLVSTDEDVREAVKALEDDSADVRLQAVCVLAAAYGSEKLWNDAEVGASILRHFLAADLDEDKSHRLPGGIHQLVEETRKKLAASVGARLPKDPELRNWVMSNLDSPRWSARLGACELCPPTQCPPTALRQPLRPPTRCLADCYSVRELPGQ